MNDYEQKQEARRERLQSAADHKRRESAARLDAAHKRGDAIPFGQPILVGHHSEKRHRRDIARIDRDMRAGVEAANEADDLQRRADAVGSGGISSDDPEAIDKLKAELADLQARQERMKQDNTEARRATLPKIWPSYKLTNNGANIRRIEKRIAELQKRAADVTTETTIDGVCIVDDVEDNRLRMFFDGKPTPDVIALLKSYGFKWSPKAGAWQRMRSVAAREAAERIIKAFTTSPATPAKS